MADHSRIEWTDATWNPVLGCDKVSAGCQHCYAVVQAWIKQHHPNPTVAAAYAGLVEQRPDGSLNWTGVVRPLPERLGLPLHWRAPRRIFVNSLSDLFHEDLDEKFIARVFAVMDLARQHTFQVLTKRPERMARLLADEDFQFHVGWFQSQAVREFGLPKPGQVGPWPLGNVWIGTSVEHQEAAIERIPWLLATPAAVRFLSCEPLLGPVNLEAIEGALYRESYEPVPYPGGIQWVIAGGESGAGFRPLDLAWVRRLRDQCQGYGVAFNFKQVGGRTHGAGGRELDGRTWDQFPEVAHV